MYQKNRSKMDLRSLFLVFFELCILFRNHNVAALEGAEIVGGLESPIEKYPFQVSVQYQNRHMCGGGMLNQLYVVTAAHCVINATTQIPHFSNFKVVGGTADLNSNGLGRKTSSVAEIHVRIDYFIFFSDYRIGDIAVLKLKRALDLIVNPNVQYLELPRESETFVGQMAVIAGYGAASLKYIQDLDTNEIIRKAEESGTLRAAPVRVLSDEDCKQYYSNWVTRLCARIIQFDRNDDKGICFGDSGSPLVIYNNILIGIVSTGSPDCNDNDKPGTYADVAKFVPFIKAVLRNEQNLQFLSFVKSRGYWRLKN